MNKSQTKVFRLSLLLILIYWVYDVTSLFQSAPAIPDDTRDLLLRIALVKTLSFTILILLLKGQGDSFSTIGWRSSKWVFQLLRGILFGLLTFVLVNVALTPFLNSLFPSANADPGIMAHFADKSFLWIWLLTAILGGGLVEEFQRVFILTRFEKWKGEKVIVLVLLIDAISFGIGHAYQGMTGAVSAGLTGVIFGLIYLRRRSFIEAFTAHALYDIIGITVGHMMMKANSN
ncbi:MAG: CPBP family intramembrane metalloprotease [Roseivirga sp.]|nr:CPBP family intramembrane metalloprotease [Roseivirga sp.]